MGRGGSAWQTPWPLGRRAGRRRLLRLLEQRGALGPSPAPRPSSPTRVTGPGSFHHTDPQRRRAKPVIVTEASPFDENLGYLPPRQNGEAPPLHEGPCLTPPPDPLRLPTPFLHPNAAPRLGASQDRPAPPDRCSRQSTDNATRLPITQAMPVEQVLLIIPVVGPATESITQVERNKTSRVIPKEGPDGSRNGSH